MAAAIAAFNLRRPVLVAASMSGGWAFPLLVADPAAVGGFVGVAPVGVREFADAVKASLSARNHRMPAVALFGSLDASHLADAETLLGALGDEAEQVVFEGAEHPAYLKYPERWHELLVGVARKVGGGGAGG